MTLALARALPSRNSKGMIDWILNQHGVVLYLVLFLLLIGGAIGLPVPEDIPLVLAGVFVNHGKLDLKTTFLVCYL